MIKNSPIKFLNIAGFQSSYRMLPLSRGAKGTVDSSCNVIEISELLLCDCSEYLMFNVTVLFLCRIASQKASVNTSHLIRMWKVKLKWMRS